MCHSRKSLNGFWQLNLHCSIYVTFLKIRGAGGQMRSCQGQESKKCCLCVLCVFCSLCLGRKHLGASCLLVVIKWPFKIPWSSLLASASLSFHSACVFMFMWFLWEACISLLLFNSVWVAACRWDVQTLDMWIWTLMELGLSLLSWCFLYIICVLCV